jgi:hypothetical protein
LAFKGRGSSIFVDADGINRFLTSYAKTVFETKRSIASKNTNRLGKIIALSEGLFRDRVDVPPYVSQVRGTSATLGGDKYGEHRRATGRFTFGGGGTFKGVLFEQGDQQGFGFPDIPRADAATDGAWRSLEYGLPANRHLMPKFVFLDAAGKRGGNRFAPLSSSVERFGSGITQKRFIRDAWVEGTKGLPKEYKALFVQHFRRFSKG